MFINEIKKWDTNNINLNLSNLGKMFQVLILYKTNINTQMILLIKWFKWYLNENLIINKS